MGVPRRLRRSTAVGLIAALLALLTGAWTSPAAAAALPPAKAYVLIDVGSGQVLAQSDDREPLRVASTAKLLTALVAKQHVPFDSQVTISARAAGEPALNINAKTGQVWLASDLYECLFIVSANDAAMALAEAAGPGLDAFHAELADEATQLGLADAPVLQDPAGLDDNFSVNGGNLLSARDLAIVARAVLADPMLAPMAAQRDFRFTGGDGLPHRIVSHDAFLAQYPGAIGLKTGYTKLAGHALVAAATRNGRTLVAVVLDAGDPVGVARNLLDLGWTLPPTGIGDQLPAVPGSDQAKAESTPVPARAAVPKASHKHSTSTFRRRTAWLLLVAGFGLMLIALMSIASVYRPRPRTGRR